MTDEKKTHYASLKAYCRSQRQSELLEAVIEHGSIGKAAKALDLRNPHTITRAIRRVENHAALQGYSPGHDMTHVVPDTHYIKGTSTLYKQNVKDCPTCEGTGYTKGDNDAFDVDCGECKGSGKVAAGGQQIALQWVKSNAKADDLLNDLRDFAAALGEQLEGEFQPVKLHYTGDALESDLLTVYPLADLHLGMLAWSRETREDYDVAIASDALKLAAEHLIRKTEPTRECIIANIGDFFHFDNDTKLTASGNILDADGRWAKVVDLGVECLLYFIRRALQKHEKVTVINSIGNHDGQSALMLPFILRPYFLNEPRVVIEDAPRMHHYYLFGANLLGFHHGHKTPANRLPMTMVNDMLLNTKINTEEVEFTHWLTGHIHHEKVEYDGCVVESFRALCAKDAYHAGAGYRALRDMQAITYHRKFGEIGRERISYRMIQHYSDLEATKSALSA